MRDSKRIQCLGDDKFKTDSSPIKQAIKDISKYGPESPAFKLALKMEVWKSCEQCYPCETQLGLREALQ